MSSQQLPSPDPAAGQLEMASGARRLVDQVDGPARPLGAKRAALQARRARETASGSPQSSRGLASKDATVAFSLRATAAGLLVERTQCQLVGARLVQTLLFKDMGRFDRWCDAEPTRFDDPLLYDQLCREGHEAFGSQR